MGCCSCSVRAVIGLGIFLAILDILHGLGSLGFYGYRFISFYFYLCPRDLAIEVCQNKYYFYEQMFSVRTYIGLGEGAITPIFNILVIIALVKRLPCLIWVWLIKGFGVIAINIFYISSWLIRRESLSNITLTRPEYENHFLMVGICLTIIEGILLVLFCIVSSVFTYKIAEERARIRRSIRSLHGRSPSFRRRNGRSSAPSTRGGFDEDDDEDEAPSYLNPNLNLNDSTNKLPYPGSITSIDKMSNSQTLRQPTDV